jgi:hypothetical protein
MTTASPSTPHATRRRWLLALLAMMALLYAALAWTFPLTTWLPHGRVSIGTVTKRSLDGTLTLAIFGIALYSCYVGGALLLWRTGPLPRLTRWLWVGAVAVAGVLAWTYPVTSTDIFDYLFRSHMTAAYGANPYLELPNQFKQDPWFRYVGWPNAPSAYGPLWEVIGWQLAQLGGSSLLANVLLLKGVAIGTFLGSGLLIQRWTRDQRWQQLSVYLWLWSPLALWEFAAGGHNDGLMVVALLLALWAVRRNQHWLAVLALTAGALFKFLPAIFLPLVVLNWMRQQQTWSRRLLVGGFACLLFAVPTVMLYIPYWDLPSAFAQLGLEDKLSAIWNGRGTTLRNITVREAFLNASPLALLSYVLRTPASLNIINDMLAGIGWGSTSDATIRGLVSFGGTLLLGAGLLWQCWHVWRHQRNLVVAFWGLLLWYLVAASQWFQPWYLVWLLALFALRPQRHTFGWLTVWALMAQASYLLQYMVLPNAQIGGQTLAAQAWYVVVIYTLPLLVWLVGWWQRQRMRRTAPVQLDPAH